MTHNPRNRGGIARRGGRGDARDNRPRPNPFGGAPLNPLATMRAVAGIMGLEQTGDRGRLYERYWNAYVEGDYAIVHAEPATNAQIMMGDGIPKQIADRVMALNHEVVHIPSRRIVRRNLPRIQKFPASAFQGERRVRSTTGVEMPPPLAFQKIHVSPLFEGVDVCIWKHGGKTFFSTRKRVDSRSFRGANRLLAELYAACGGPTMGELFPMDLNDPNGSDVSYHFTVVHPSLMKASSMPVGKGYVVFNGAICANTGAFVSVHDERVKWDTEDVLVDPTQVEIPQIPGTKAAGDVEGLDGVERTEECDLLGDASLAEMDLLEHGLFAPLPPPSAFGGKFPERGNANEAIRKSLFEGAEPVDEEAGLPPVYTLPHLEYEDAMAHLTHGPRHTADGRPRPTQNGFFSLGEPIVVTHIIERAGLLVPARRYVFVPEGYAWRSAVLAENTNLTQRMMQLFELSRAPPTQDAFAVPEFVSAMSEEIWLPSGAYSGRDDSPPLPSYEALLGSASSFIPNMDIVQARDAVKYAEFLHHPEHFIQGEFGPLHTFERNVSWAGMALVICAPEHRKEEARHAFVSLANVLVAVPKVAASIAKDQADGKRCQIVAECTLLNTSGILANPHVSDSLDALFAMAQKYPSLSQVVNSARRDEIIASGPAACALEHEVPAEYAE